jgi:hypothetical protein
LHSDESDWHALGTDRVLNAVHAFLRRFVVLSENQADAITLWVLHTHALEAAETTPYLAITSPEKRSGKTRLLEVLELLVARPWLTGRTTAAALARKVDALTPTLLLDESDAAFKSGSEYAEALRGLLNTGYRRSGKATVVVPKGTSYGFADLATFGPKAIAGIGGLADTVLDRSIRIRLERKLRGDGVDRFYRRDVEPEGANLEALAADWATPNIDTLRAARPALPDELDDRAQDVWEPLLAIAELAGPSWRSRGRAAAVSLSGPQVREEESMAIRLLADMRRVFDENHAEMMRSSDVLAALAAELDAPWGDWYGKAITAQAVAKILKPFGIRTMEIWIDGQKARGYRRDRLQPVWDRYLTSGGSR